MRQVRPPCILDVEASGFGPSSYPIEIGVVLEDGAKYCSLVAPVPGWTHWDQSAERIHHVSRELLAARGKPVARVADELNGLLADRTVYTDGWVVDLPWMLRLFEAARQPSRFTVSALEMILTEPQMDIWHATKDDVVRDLDLKRHRASNDALIIQQTWLRTREAADGA
jgi:hypothetical protein